MPGPRFRECTSCYRSLPSSSYTKYRRLNNIHVCTECDPVAKGRHTDRRYWPDSKYVCTTCDKELHSDWFVVRKSPTGPHRLVSLTCRRCQRKDKQDKKYGADEAESLLRSDCIYDFDLARCMFGMSYAEAIAWIINGYPGEDLTEERLWTWGLTETRRELWNPD